MEKVQIIPPPKEVDPRVLAWKGGAVLGKMDGVSDLWLTAADWVCNHSNVDREPSDVEARVPFAGHARYARSQRTLLLLVNFCAVIGLGGTIGMIG